MGKACIILDCLEKMFPKLYQQLKNPSTALLDQAVVTFSNFLVFVLFAKHLAINELGQFTLLFTLAVILSGVHNALVAEPIRIYGVEYKSAGLKLFLNNQLKIRGLVLFLLCVISLPIYKLFFDFNFNIYLSFIVFLFLFVTYQLIRSVYIALFDIKSLFWLDVKINIIRIILTTIFLYSFQVSLNSVLLIATIGWLAATVIFYFAYVKLNTSNCEHSEINFNSEIVKNWSIGKWIVLETVAFSLSTQIYILVLGVAKGSEDVAIFGVLQNLLNVANVLIAGLSFYATSTVRALLLEKGISVWFKQLRLYGLMTLIAVSIFLLLISVFGELIMPILYNDYYADYSYLIPILSVSYVLMSINSFYRIYFISSNNARIPSLARVLSLLITIIIIFPITQAYGLIGVCIGLIVTQITWFCFYLYNQNRHLVVIKKKFIN